MILKWVILHNVDFWYFNFDANIFVYLNNSVSEYFYTVVLLLLFKCKI